MYVCEYVNEHECVECVHFKLLTYLAFIEHHVLYFMYCVACVSYLICISTFIVVVVVFLLHCKVR